MMFTRLAQIALTTMLIAGSSASSRAESDRYVERVVTRHVQAILPAGKPGGAAVAVRIEGRTLFFNYGLADFAARRPITPDTLFNLASLRKVFETTLLAQAVRKGELALDDPVSRYVAELQQGGDIRRVTLGQLATHTSGLLLPQDHPPWPDWVTRCRSSSARSMLGGRTSSPASRTSIPTPAISCCSSRSSAGTARRSTS
jgi:beta-lactamase class C